MKRVFVPLFLILTLAVNSQFLVHDTTQQSLPLRFAHIKNPDESGVQIRLQQQKWKISRNHVLTGTLMFFAGAAKGFNETLQFNYHGFHNVFPKASKYWFDPVFSFTNKYKDHDPAKGAAYPLSTSVLVMFTDQYHLNNFIQRGCMTAALVLKLGQGKKPFRYYVFDALFYTAAYQAGFGSVYYPFKARNK